MKDILRTEDFGFLLVGSLLILLVLLLIEVGSKSARVAELLVGWQRELLSVLVIGAFLVAFGMMELWPLPDLFSAFALSGSVFLGFLMGWLGLRLLDRCNVRLGRPAAYIPRWIQGLLLLILAFTVFLDALEARSLLEEKRLIER